MHWLLLLIPFLLAFGYRARGGAIPLGNDTLARIIFWALPVAISCAFVFYLRQFSFWLLIPIALLAFGGVTIPHASMQGNTIENNEGMSVITSLMLFMLLIPINVYTLYNYLPFVPAIVLPFGLLGGLGYYLGYRYPFNLKLFGIQWVTAGDASAGELIGSALAFGLPIALLGVIEVFKCMK